MGEQFSCCHTKSQLDNASITSNRISEPYLTPHSIKKTNTAHIPTNTNSAPAGTNISNTTNSVDSTPRIPPIKIPLISQQIKNLITMGEKSSYYKNNRNNSILQKQTISYGNNYHGAVYSGETNNAVPHGFGNVTFANGTVFQGSFSKGVPTNGIIVLNKHSYYVGDIEQFQASGQGVYQNIKNGYLYEGEWKKSLQHGKGVQKYGNRDQYNGEFMCGKKFGQGQYKFSDGKIYNGSFYNGLSDGHGILTLPNGDIYDGQWRLGQMHGKGAYKWKNGEKYQGEYMNGVKQNLGKYYFSNGATYQGGWDKGLQEGEGIVREGFDQVKGQWKQGKIL